MPFYEYLCTECGRHTEILQRISDPVATECPACHAQALVKQVSAAGFRLKGGGWYETDFKSSGQKNLVGDSAAASSEGGEAPKASGHGCAAGACGCAAPSAASSSTTSSASTSTTASSSTSSSTTPA